MFQVPPFRYILPNLFTLASAFCGFALITLSWRAETGAQFFSASLLVPLACFLDGFDGRVARMVHAESKFGMQLDSLADMMTFGVAPAFLIYRWALEPLGFWGLLAAFSLPAAAMLRLARFNVESEADNGCSRYFTGLPAPMGGAAVAGLVAVESGFFSHAGPWANGSVSHAALVTLASMLMVSVVPFRTFKDVRMTSKARTLLAGFATYVVVTSILVDFMFAMSIALFAYVATTLFLQLVRRSNRAIAEPDGLLEELQDFIDDELDLNDSEEETPFSSFAKVHKEDDE